MTQQLTRGGNVGLAAAGLGTRITVTLTWEQRPGADADLSAFLCTGAGKVRNDDDFVFYNQPTGGDGSVTHVGKSQRGSTTVDQVTLDVARVPAGIEKVVIGASFDGAGSFGDLRGLGVEVAADQSSPAAIRCEFDATTETAMVFAEVYLRNGEWKVRAVGQGYTNGLAGLATDFGVSVDDDPAPAPPSAPPSPSSTAPTPPTPASPPGPPTFGTSAPPAPAPAPSTMPGPPSFGSAAPAPAPAPAPASAAPPAPGLSLEKKRLLSLEKNLTSTGDTKMLSLVKTAGVSLEKKGLGEHTARVALCLDISASMTSRYSRGLVQKLAERVLALGLRFDDDGEVDVFLFGADVHHANGLSLDGYQGYVPKMLNEFPLEYGTRYGAAIGAIRKHYFGTSGDRAEPIPDAVPVYVMFLTDGAPSDKAVATKQIRSASYEPIFWQFMGIGNDRFEYLQKLDDLDQRHVDNADFFAVSDDELIGRSPITDDALFERLMTEYPTWLTTARRSGLLHG